MPIPRPSARAFDSDQTPSKTLLTSEKLLKLSSRLAGEETRVLQRCY